MRMRIRTRFARSWRSAAVALFFCVLAAMAFATAAGPAFADATQPSEEASSAASSQDDEYVSVEGVEVSADGREARIEGASFAVESFHRAQKGSNNDIEGTYVGYAYYEGDTPDAAVAVSTPNYVVVHVPPAFSDLFTVGDEAAESYLKRYFVALDDVALNGGVVFGEDIPWHFTDDDSFETDGIVYRFGVEAAPGEFYVTVAGPNGEDVMGDDAQTTDNRPTHVDFCALVPSDDVVIEAAPTGIEAFAQFLASIDYSPLWITLKTTGTAIVFIFVLGLAAAYFSLRIPKRAQDVADAIFTIPMVLPPTVCGFLLLLALGRNTALGQWFIDIGFPLIFSWPATVIAAIVVAFPLMYRNARGAFEGLDPNMLDAARTLGWSNGKIFLKLMLPLSWSSIAAGTVLSFARALGEFGATLFLAGNYAGVTRTIPIAIYFEWMSGNIEVALFWTVIIIIFSFIVILFINLWGRRTTKYRRRAES
ncbi:molybdate ABC transporter permease subunit [Eggerthellaceae bacterium zg-887]|nr:molybdate ABC transporter permease subunit [Xiamenia xianingshaonis]